MIKNYTSWWQCCFHSSGHLLKPQVYAYFLLINSVILSFHLVLQVISGLKMKPGFYNPQLSILLSLNLFHYWRQTKHEIINSRIMWDEKANSEDRRKLYQTLPCPARTAASAETIPCSHLWTALCGMSAWAAARPSAACIPSHSNRRTHGRRAEIGALFLRFCVQKPR